MEKIDKLQEIEDPSKTGVQGLKFAEEKPKDTGETDYSTFKAEDIIQRFNSTSDVRRAEHSYGRAATAQQAGLTPGMTFEGYGDSKYDATATSKVQLLNLEKHRKLEFELDLKNFSIKFFLCSFMFLVIGRYIYIRKKPADDKFHEVKSTLNKDIIE